MKYLLNQNLNGFCPGFGPLRWTRAGLERTRRSRAVWLNSAVSVLLFCSSVGRRSTERWEEGDQGSSHLQDPGGESRGDPPLDLMFSSSVYMLSCVMSELLFAAAGKDRRPLSPSCSQPQEAQDLYWGQPPGVAGEAEQLTSVQVHLLL